MVECVFCDSAATRRDSDMDMWMCDRHFKEMNGSVSEIELDEVW